MTRILHVLDHSLPAHSGYTFRTRALMKAQAAKGWAVAGVTGVRQPDSGGKTGADGETVDGLTFYRTPSIAPVRSPIREWREIGALASRIEALVRAWQPDLLHAHSPVLDAMAALRVGKRLGIPVLYEIRAFWEDAAVGNGTGREHSARYYLTRTLETRAVKAADAVAVICDGLRGDLIARGVDPAKIIVSPNGVDLDLFGDPPPRDAALAARLGLGDGDAVIGFIGSFYDYEGIGDLIAAMPALAAAQPRARLLLVGGGPMEDALKAQAAASPVADRIRFVGRVPHSEVDHYYSLIDILAYPRKKMRLTDLVTPLKPLEAMAQGKLVAASDVGGHRELIEDGATGTLFAPDDPAAIAAALAGLLGRRDLWDDRRRTARLFVETHRNWSSNILRYEPVYQRLLAHRAPSLAA
ncbi:TIGR04063 family PEP-CTERM/XrtA system glycosyltransferase [Sphingopyxis panaciterrulae]|uniref:PEP-CTERM/exosortase A-associated glycosyltransferase n=1 Tax=Sphingopyxis panaciterrulae TaxID=462372 RepID=A0A7W9B2T7_9SPHN|nr:TIGR04063 family PEP-CTERM/XrtA system glycosyltransferase [Sphingopyxis panaciterrulae]MBB5705189.1 PEP-CTERM/exosortase A-associated glycosyltransferase [Sphingopyxis panaciterrulae]